MFSTSTDSPANREIARLLAFLDEPKAVPMILAHQASVPDHAAQIHDAYCLRAIKRGLDRRNPAEALVLVRDGEPLGRGLQLHRIS